jgi:hypothetical protein
LIAGCTRIGSGGGLAQAAATDIRTPAAIPRDRKVPKRTDLDSVDLISDYLQRGGELWRGAGDSYARIAACRRPVTMRFRGEAVNIP